MSRVRTRHGVVVDTTALIEAAKSFDSADLSAGLSETLNTELKRFEVTTRKAMVENIALTQGYVESKTTFNASSKNRLRASIVVGGSLVVLGHYNPRVLYKPASSRARGDRSRGIPAGHKARGVEVTVRPGQPKELRAENAFVMRLKRGTDQGDKLGVFTREGKHRILHRYGIAPYSLFNYQAGQREGEFLNELQENSLNDLLRRFNLL